MAIKLNLMADSGTVADLVTGALQVSINGWSHPLVIGNGDPIWETFELVGRGTSITHLKNAIGSITTFIQNARYTAQNSSYQIKYTLNYQTDTGGEIRSPITDGQLIINSEPGTGGLGPYLRTTNWVSATMALEHPPFWESYAQQEPGTALNVSLFGGTANLDASLAADAYNGDLPSRIDSLNLTGLSGISQLDDVWIGIRPVYSGSAGFTPLWECEYGSMATGGGGSIIAEAAASNGTTVRIDFSGTAAMIQRMRINVEDVITTGADYENFAGKYLVLGNVKCGTATECLIDTYVGLNMAGYGSATRAIELVGETKVTNTSYKLIELGQIQIPPYGIQATGGASFATGSDTSIYLFAQRLSGTSYLYLDALITIPCEHMLTVKNAGVDYELDIIKYRSGIYGKSAVAMVEGTDNFAELLEYTETDFVYPIKGAIIVLAGQANSGSDSSCNMDLVMNTWKRHSLFYP